MHRFLTPHLSLMANDILLSFKGLCAGFALKKPLVAVDVLLVDLQVAAVRKRLLADFTAIDDICFDAMVCAARRKKRKSYFGCVSLISCAHA